MTKPALFYLLLVIQNGFLYFACHFFVFCLSNDNKAEIPDMSDIGDYKSDSISESLKELSLLDSRTKKKVYFELVSLAYTDSEYSVEEKELIKSVIYEFGLSDSECKEMDSIAEGFINLLNRLGVLLNG